MPNDAMGGPSAAPICLDLWLRPPSRPPTSSRVRLFDTGQPTDPFRPVWLAELKWLWNPGDTVRVAFLDGDAGLRQRVADVAEEWTHQANLVLRFVDAAEESDVRVSFDDHLCAWSRIGTSCRCVSQSMPTMNIGLLTAESDDETVRQLTLHEFGHALGLLHEHQHPELGISWNRPAVYNFFARRPYRWNRDDVNRNIFDRYSRDRTVHRHPDTRSIMMYPISPALTTDGFGVELNMTLSENDRQFIAQCYPFAPTTP